MGSVNGQSGVACRRSLLLAVILLTSLSEVLNHQLDYTGTGCEGTTFVLSCPTGYFITVQTATYGRSDADQCKNDTQLAVPVPAGGCSLSSALSIVRSKCDNKDYCQLLINSETFPQDPCPGTSKYITLAFVCKEPEYKGLQCQGKTIRLECPGSFFIQTAQVFYGRQDDQTCSDQSAVSSTNCSQSDALQTVSQLCDHKRSCDIFVDTPLLGDPCPGTDKYMEVIFHCSVCINDYSQPAMCDQWAEDGECATNRDWMQAFCREACLKCTYAETCANVHELNYAAECGYWASQGECRLNEDWMTASCRRSCNLCPREAPVNTPAPPPPTTPPAPTTPPPHIPGSSTVPPSSALTDKQFTNSDTTTDNLFPRHLSVSSKIDTALQLSACEGDPVTLTCPAGQSLRIFSAMFGRTDNTTCPHATANNVVCGSLPDVLDKVRFTCEGRQTCSVSAYSDALGDPCPGTHKYLQVFYTCQDCRNEYSRGDGTACLAYAEEGECTANAIWMKDYCFLSCTGCSHSECGNAYGDDVNCDYWSTRRECVQNTEWMTKNCQTSCRKCPGKTTTTTTTTAAAAAADTTTAAAAVTTTTIRAGAPASATTTVTTVTTPSTRPTTTAAPVCSPQCGSHGLCMPGDTCECDVGYGGATCEDYSCISLQDCSGHGQCTGPSVCTCQSGWVGDTCSSFACRDVSDCSGRGRCYGPNMCACFPYFSGDDCSTCFVSFEKGPSCLPCPDCIYGTCVLESGGVNVGSYRGCYLEVDSDPDMDYLVWENTGTPSTSLCMKDCYARGYKYAALQNGHRCHCSNSYGKHGNSTGCSMACQGGESWDICGGVAAISVWQVYEGTCQCNGPNVTGLRCNHCSVGYEGPNCNPTRRTTTLASSTAPSTNASTTTTPSSTPSKITTTPTASTPSTTSAITTTTSTSTSTSPNPKTSTTTTTISSTTTTTTTTKPTTSTVPTTTTTASAKPGTQTSYIVHMVLRIDEEGTKWKNSYTDFSLPDTKGFIDLLEEKLKVFYRKTLGPTYKVVNVHITSLRQGIVVEHNVSFEQLLTSSQQILLQCSIAERVRNSKVSSDLSMKVPSELSDKCVVATSYCKNGGSVDYKGAEFVCTCAEEYNGQTCENAVVNPNVIIVIAVICCAVPLIGILVLCFLLRNRFSTLPRPSEHQDSTVKSFQYQGMSKARKSTNRQLFGPTTTQNGVNNEGFVPRQI